MVGTLLHLGSARESLTNNDFVQPSVYVRYMFNRTFLESSVVRAGAVAALTKLARAVPSLRDDISGLLSLRLEDNDDEVREAKAVQQ